MSQWRSSFVRRRGNPFCILTESCILHKDNLHNLSHVIFMYIYLICTTTGSMFIVYIYIFVRRRHIQTSPRSTLSVLGHHGVIKSWPSSPVGWPSIYYCYLHIIKHRAWFWFFFLYDCQDATPDPEWF